MDSLILMCIWPLILVSVEAHCDLEGFDLNSLSNASYWNLIIIEEGWDWIIPQDHSADNITGCTIYFSVCKPLPKGICSDYTDSSTCLVVTTNDNDHHYFNIGNYSASPDHGFVPTEGEELGFAVDRHGSIANPGTSGSRKHYETVMTWRCEPDVNCDPSSNDVTLFAIDITYNYSSYSLGILFDYSGACPHAPPTGTPTATPPLYTTNHGQLTSATPPLYTTNHGQFTSATPPPYTTNHGQLTSAIPPLYTTNHGQLTSQTPDEGQKPNIGGLIAGVVVSASVCAILLALLLTAVWYMLFYKRGGVHRNIPYNDL